MELEIHSENILICGSNGAGKTSILEAVHLLGRGRSFREQVVSDLIQRNEKSLELFARVRRTDETFQIGCALQTRKRRWVLNGAEVKKRSLLFDALPMFLVTPHAKELIERGTTARRALLDLGLFHVEPNARFDQANFRRVLTQRNALLKANQRLNEWDNQFLTQAIKIDQLRKSLFQSILDVFNEIAPILLPALKIQLMYKQGWPAEQSLKTQLGIDHKRDFTTGSTNSGPHRADIRIEFYRDDQKVVASRGEQKLTAFCLIEAVRQVYINQAAKNPVLLYDDLSAELDGTNTARLAEFIFQSPGQKIISTADLTLKSDLADHCEVFHVEQGQLI